MKIKDKNIGEMVNVSCSNCLYFDCYWPRPDPGIFVQGRGYQTRNSKEKPEYRCGNRDIHGCPEIPTLRSDK
jgi:hypothetical protein